jgi:hypothetical protein
MGRLRLPPAKCSCGDTHYENFDDLKSEITRMLDIKKLMWRATELRV